MVYSISWFIAAASRFIVTFCTKQSSLHRVCWWWWIERRSIFGHHIGWWWCKSKRQTPGNVTASVYKDFLCRFLQFYLFFNNLSLELNCINHIPILVIKMCFFDSFVFCSAVLEPNLYLCFCQIQCLGDFKSSRTGDILITLIFHL